MKNSRVSHFVLGAIIAAYLVPAILSPRNLIGQTLIFELHSSFQSRTVGALISMNVPTGRLTDISTLQNGF